MGDYPVSGKNSDWSVLCTLGVLAVSSVVEVIKSKASSFKVHKLTNN